MWKFYVKKLFYYLKRIILWALIILLVGALIVTIYICIQDIFATKAKDYLLEKYELNKMKIYAIKTTDYVYEKDMQCENLWFKECTDDENLEKEVIFYNFNKEKIKVKVYRDGTYEDDYDGTIREKYLEKLKKKAEEEAKKQAQQQQQNEDIT